MKKELRSVKVNAIRQDVNSRPYDSKSSDVAELMASIKEEGLLQPIAVTPIGGKKEAYTVVYGNRRFMACKKLGMIQVDAYVFENLDWKDLLILNLAENMQRKDVTAYQEGTVVHELIEQHAMTLKEVAVRLGVDLGRVRRVLKLYKDLPAEWRDRVVNKPSKKTRGTGTALSKDDSKDEGAAKISSSVAERIIRVCKDNNVNSKTNINKMLSLAADKKMSMEQIKHAVTAMSNDRTASIGKVVKKASSLKIVTISLPMYTTDHEQFQSTAHFVRESRKVLYEAWDMKNPLDTDTVAEKSKKKPKSPKKKK